MGERGMRRVYGWEAIREAERRHEHVMVARGSGPSLRVEWRGPYEARLMISPVNEGNIYLDLPAEEESEEADETESDVCPFCPNTSDICEETGPDYYICTRQRGHGGLHVACGSSHAVSHWSERYDAALSALRECKEAFVELWDIEALPRMTSLPNTQTAIGSAVRKAESALATADQVLGESEGEGKG